MDANSVIEEKFYVRNPHYEQSSNYGNTCKEITLKALELENASLSDVVKLVATEMKRRRLPMHSTDFGRIRDHDVPDDQIYTPLSNKYLPAIERYMSSHGIDQDNFTRTITYNAPGIEDTRLDHSADGQAILPLATLVYKKRAGAGKKDWFAEAAGNGYILHPMINKGEAETPANNHFSDEHLFASASKAFDKALHGNSTEEKTEGMQECYWLLSQDAMLARGSATLSRVVLEYMSQQNGIEVPVTKHGYDLNVEAIIRDCDEFKKDWNNNVYFETSPAVETKEAVAKWIQLAVRLRQ